MWTLYFIFYLSVRFGFIYADMDACIRLGGDIAVGKKCYKYYNTSLSWFGAQKYCRTHLYRGTLAEFYTDEEIQVVTKLPKKSSPGFWLGATDQAEEGHFTWASSGLKADTIKIFWGSGQPIRLNYIIVVPALIKYQTAYLQMTSDYTFPNVSLLIQVYNDTLNTTDVSFSLGKSITFAIADVLSMNRSETYKSYVSVTSYQWVTVVLYVTDDQHKMFASTLVYPARMFVLLSEAYFVLPFLTNYTENNIDVVAMMNGSTDVAVYFITQDFSAQLNNDLYIVRLSPYSMLVSRATLETQFETFHLNLITDLQRGFLTASRAVAVFLSRSRPDTPEYEPSIDEMLPVEYIGTEYITFPSLPFTEVNDTFLLVAAHEDTQIQIRSLGANISLSSVGASRVVELSGGKFHFIQGDVGFYLYKWRPPGATENVCETSLLPKSWWRNQYDFTISSELASWMVYVVVVVDKYYMAKISLLTTAKLTCSNVIGNNLLGCLYNMTSLSGTFNLIINNPQATFGAYMYGTNKRSTFCHPLGVADELLPSWYTDKDNFKMELKPQRQPEISCSNIILESSKPASSRTTSSNMTTHLYTTIQGLQQTTALPTPANNGTDVTNYTRGLVTRDTTTVIQAVTTEEDLSTHSFSTDGTTHTQTIATEATTIHAQTTTTMEPAKQAEKLVNEIKKTLQVNSRNTSAFLRTKTSTEDPRPSATAVGYVGIVMLSMVFGTIVILDIARFVCYMLNILKNIK